MQTIIVRYYETVIDPGTGDEVSALLGTESYDDIREALIPGRPAVKPGRTPPPIFLTKCFSTSAHHRWELLSVASEAATATKPAIFTIFLQPQDVSKEVFLYQTLKKDKNQTLTKLVRPGTLVEVDYGFVQHTGRLDGSTKTNKRYCDTRLDGEMYKRRLAVVVKVVRSNLVQVAPVSSSAPTSGGKSFFMMSQATLDKMPRYKFSGKDSYVLCDRTETVSTQRLLPPVSFGRSVSSRNVGYTVAISRAEEKLFKAALLNAVGVTNYVLHNDYLQEKLRADKLQEENARLKEALEASREQAKVLTTVENMAKRWAAEWDLDYHEDLEIQRELDGAAVAEV
ncbi:type II toxin-antitoxin system PemK/MazF family toxin [Enterobacterales bacterium BD_CKDN230030183-1A_HGKHYDSX7]|uniref:Type II toxin-antitoxin system PemK/MazF family toxin n=1 Tax=Pseudomonas taiwanensis TaxID=470150 RepID=A0A7L9GJS8_9PSED|nr:MULTISPECIES: type II toxin-antitoxin system PemK/MazF family toxin [Pseudomonas]QOJ92769.1 type II toxin-antitoxin system PemK/MazF family toxin [Pseudomonas taiwanensis]WQQ36802.1 type II toxin-antitoxin system PemK/MazF family toxin [Pseudomonas putida]